MSDNDSHQEARAGQQQPASYQGEVEALRREETSETFEHEGVAYTVVRNLATGIVERVCRQEDEDQRDEDGEPPWLPMAEWPKPLSQNWP